MHKCVCARIFFTWTNKTLWTYTYMRAHWIVKTWPNIEWVDTEIQIRAYFSFKEQYILTRIEPVGKPYREVCLLSELWPWMAHQPNSWSKHPGTRIEQVLAYCRDEQKYVGCIELLFCLTVTMTFGVRTWKFIGLMDEILPICQLSFTEIRSQIREK